MTDPVTGFAINPSTGNQVDPLTGLDLGPANQAGSGAMDAGTNWLSDAQGISDIFSSWYRTFTAPRPVQAPPGTPGGVVATVPGGVAFSASLPVLLLIGIVAYVALKR